MSSMLNTAARRAAPSLASSVRNAGKQQMRFAHGEHFDTFGVNPNSKLQTYSYYAAMTAALAAPAVAIKYQLDQGKKDNRHF